jgi:pimeloyl-ACP methyl ester carboxylesterase
MRLSRIKFVLATVVLLLSEVAHASECVVLLHGLARTADSMSALARRLTAEGYRVSNIDYPSRDHPVEVLANIAVEQGLAECDKQSPSKIHFVTHSLGGILVRVYLKTHHRTDIGRVVMLGPPNQGSQVVDNLKNAPGYKLLNGPAGMQLGTKSADIPKSLGPVDFQLGVIAGTQSINLILSTFLPNPNDGKVSVESTKAEGMSDFVALPTTHPFMMKNDAVIDQTVYFLKHGKFQNIGP